MSNQLTVRQLIALLEKLPQDALVHSDFDEINTEITGVKVYSQLDRTTGQTIELIAIGNYE